jgi:hypothetical protein
MFAISDDHTDTRDRYFTDMTGSFECVRAPAPRAGVVMRQMVPEHPIAWRHDEQRPFTVLTGDIAWHDSDVALNFSLSAATDVVRTR